MCTFQTIKSDSFLEVFEDAQLGADPEVIEEIIYLLYIAKLQTQNCMCYVTFTIIKTVLHSNVLGAFSVVSLILTSSQCVFNRHFACVSFAKELFHIVIIDALSISVK